MNVNFKDKAWKLATATVVLIVILNPEFAELALFIDAVGLEMFLMLIEVQVIAIFSVFFSTKIKPICIYVKSLCLRLIPINCWINIKKNPDALMLAVPSPAMLMNALVVLTLISIVFNVY